MTRAASPAMSDKSQANKLGAILLSKGLALNAAMIKPGRVARNLLGLF